MRRPGPAAALAVAVGLVLAACGGSSDTATTSTRASSTAATVNTSAVQSGIKAQLSEPGATVTSVKCPSGVKSKAGATFDCSVSWSNGATGKVKVTETSVGHYTYAPVSGSVQVPGSTVEKSLQQQLVREGAPNATVNCPQTIIVKVGSPVMCAVSGAGGQANGSVTFEFTSAEGTTGPSSMKNAG